MGDLKKGESHTASTPSEAICASRRGDTLQIRRCHRRRCPGRSADRPDRPRSRATSRTMHSFGFLHETGACAAGYHRRYVSSYVGNAFLVKAHVRRRIGKFHAPHLYDMNREGLPIFSSHSR